MGSSIALGMDGGTTRFVRNISFVRWWKVAWAGSSMAFGMDDGGIKLARNTLFVCWWVVGWGRVGWGGAGSSMALGMDAGMSALARNTLFVRCWKAAGAGTDKVFLASLLAPLSMPNAIEDPGPPPTIVVNKVFFTCLLTPSPMPNAIEGLRSSFRMLRLKQPKSTVDSPVEFRG